MTDTTATTAATLTPADQHGMVIAEDSRTIEGIVLPWGEFGKTNNGALQFEPGSLKIPRDVSRVKLLAGHSPTGVPIGYATSWESREDGVFMRFQLSRSPEADRALADAADKAIDAFSIESHIGDRRGTTVTDSTLSAVALVPMPAFANARVETVMASAPTADHEDDQDDEDDQDTSSDDKPDDDQTTDTDTDTDDEDEDTMSKKTLTPGTLPGTDQQKTDEVHASLDQMMNYLVAATRGDSSAELHAELTDITDASMIDRSAPQWLGELWSGVTYQRRIIPLMTQAPLKSRKAIGYRWKTKPGVDKYAGNKTEIPSKGASVETVERDAQRWAGGNDLDRVFWDFQETEFLNAYWRAMAESYAMETDRDAAQFLIQNAAVIDGGADNIIHAAARGSIAISQELQGPPSFVLINPKDFESVLQMNTLDAPKFLDIIPGTDPTKWEASSLVPAGTMVLGSKPAATHYELPGSPLRVEAEHIAKGGRDAALFGYTAKMLNRPEALRKIQFSTEAKPVTNPGTTG